MWNSRNKIIVLSLITIINLNANDSYFNDGKKGWFWGEEKAQEKKDEQQLPSIPDLTKIKNSNFNDENFKKVQDMLKKKDELNDGVITYNGKEYKTISTQTSVPWEILDTLHPEELGKIETETRNISISYPTNENVLEYKKLQHYIAKKALGFTDANYLVTRQDSEISNWVAETSMRNRVEIDAKREDNLNKGKEVLQEHKNNMIILVATSPTCPYCKKQMPLIDKFYKDYDVEYKEIDISKNKEFAMKYQVQKTPDLFLLYRDTNDEPLLTRFGSGLHSLSDIKSGVLAGLVTFNKISKEYLNY